MWQKHNSLLNLLKDILLGAVANKTTLNRLAHAGFHVNTNVYFSRLNGECVIADSRLAACLTLWPTALPFSTSVAPSHSSCNGTLVSHSPLPLASFWCCQRCQLNSFLEVLIQTLPVAVSQTIFLQLTYHLHICPFLIVLLLLLSSFICVSVYAYICILDANPLLNMWFANIFSLSVTFFF